MVVVNQVSGFVNDDGQNNRSMDPYASKKSTPALGLTWSTMVNSRILLERSQSYFHPLPGNTGATDLVAEDRGMTRRSMKVLFSSYKSTDESVEYFIDENGVAGVEG